MYRGCKSITPDNSTDLFVIHPGKCTCGCQSRVQALGFVPHYLEHVTQSAAVAALHNLLHHSVFHTVTVAMHSFVIVGPFLALSAVLYRPALPFFVGMLAHGITDFLTHRQWVYNHFFPIPLAPIEGIVSYTDVGFTIAEHALLLLFVVWWVLKRKDRPYTT